MAFFRRERTSDLVASFSVPKQTFTRAGDITGSRMESFALACSTPSGFVFILCHLAFNWLAVVLAVLTDVGHRSHSHRSTKEL